MALGSKFLVVEKIVFKIDKKRYYKWFYYQSDTYFRRCLQDPIHLLSRINSITFYSYMAICILFVS